MWIGGTPTFTLKTGGFRVSQPLPFPLGENHILFYSARYALSYGLSCLGLKPGDKLLAPAYCCGTEVDPILNKRIEIEWYDVDENLCINIRHLKEQWQRGIKVLLVIHYLGFDQVTSEVVDFCEKKKILLIEDCAHAFLSLNEQGEPLGSEGDAAFFSLRKTLPLPDGGALFLKNNDLSSFHPTLEKPNPFAIFFRSVEMLGWNSMPSGSNKLHPLWFLSRYFGKALSSSRIFFRIFHRLFGGCSDCLVHPNSYDFSPRVANWDMSLLSKRLLQFQDWKDIFESRRRNFACLLEKIEGIGGIRPLFSSLPDGVCPLFFPIFVKNREKVHNLLLKHGIDSHPWWGYFHPQVPWGNFPQAVRLKKEILGLPIHQDLDQKHMSKIARTLDLVARDH